MLGGIAAPVEGGHPHCLPLQMNSNGLGCLALRLHEVYGLFQTGADMPYVWATLTQPEQKSALPPPAKVVCRLDKALPHALPNLLDCTFHAVCPRDQGCKAGSQIC